MKGYVWPLVAVAGALFVLAGCTGSDRMMLIEHNQESLDSNLNQTQTKLSQLDQEKVQLNARLDEIGQRLAALESNMDQQKASQERVDKRLDQIEVALRDSLKSSQAQMQQSLDQNMAEAKTKNESDIVALKAEVQRLSENQQTLVGEVNKRLDAVKKDLDRFDREIDKVYTEVPKMLQKSGGGSAAPASSADGKTYKVQPGDTLSSIARDHGVTIEALRAANGMNSDTIQAGRELKIP